MSKRRYNNDDTLEFVTNKLQKININSENTQLIKVSHDIEEKNFYINYSNIIFNYIKMIPFNYSLIINKFNSINSLMSHIYNKLNKNVTKFNIKLDKIDKKIKLIKMEQHQTQ